MRLDRQRIYTIGLRAFAVALVLCGASGAAAVYVGKEQILGPSFKAVHGADCLTVAVTRAKDAHGLLVRQFISANADDDLMRLRTALRVAEATKKEQAPHLVQVSVIDERGPETLSKMRGRAVGAKVTLIRDPATDAEKSGAFSGFSVMGSAGPDGKYYGIRYDAALEDIKAMSAQFEEVTGCSSEPAGSGSK